MDWRPRVKGRIANFGIFLDLFEFKGLDDFFYSFKKFGLLGNMVIWGKPRFPMD